MRVSCRQDAARLLRQIRSSSQDVSMEDLEVLRCMFPDSRAICHRYIEWMMKSGQTEDADRAIDCALSSWPDDRWLLLRRAERSLNAGQLDRVEAVVDRLLDRWAECGSSWCVAAKLALFTERFDVAVTYAENGIRVRGKPDVIEAMAMILQSCGATSRAADLVVSDSRLNPLVRARVLIECGQICDGLVVLDDQIKNPDWSEIREEIQLLRIETLERLGLRSKLKRLLMDEHRCSANVRLRLAVTRLWMGDWIGAARVAWSFRHNRGLQHRGLTVLAVASAMVGRFSLVDRAVRVQQSSHDAFDRDWFELVWRRALMGRVIADQKDFFLAGRDPAHSLLRTLTVSSIHALQQKGDHALTERSGDAIERLNSWLHNSDARQAA